MRWPTKALIVVTGCALLAPAASAQLPSTKDPRARLAAGVENAGVAARGIELLAHRNKPAGWFNPVNPGDFEFINSDVAFQGNYAFVGGFYGFQIWDIADPANPILKTAVVCPGGQGDVSVYQNLLFLSVEETRAKKDCTTSPVATTRTRFRGVRIFDISDLDAPRQVAGVQTCRGSHTHTLVEGKDDPNSVYIYNSGTSGTFGQTSDLKTCSRNPRSAKTPLWRIEVIRVPLATPQNARVVNAPRLFRRRGAVNGLQNEPPTRRHPSGTGWLPYPSTDACHDITVYEQRDLAAGSCQGNGLLIDISNPARPRRIHSVADPNFSYWHGATFSNDGRKVVFTDEWGGGVLPRCRRTDQRAWGADAIYAIVRRKLVFRSYYKLPAAQTRRENCVSHLSSLVPVRGRDVMIQAWYQGGASLVDFTDARKPKEIGFYDRGPLRSDGPVLGGFWSTYWYNGAIFGSEIARGFDSFRLTPTTDLSAAEIATALGAGKQARFNPQTQSAHTWP